MSRDSSLIFRGIRLPFFYGWLLVAVGFITMAVGVNARTAFSLLFPAILDEFGWDRGHHRWCLLVRVSGVSGRHSVRWLADRPARPETGDRNRRCVDGNGPPFRHLDPRTVAALPDPWR